MKEKIYVHLFLNVIFNKNYFYLLNKIKYMKIIKDF